MRVSAQTLRLLAECGDDVDMSDAYRLEYAARVNGVSVFAICDGILATEDDLVEDSKNECHGPDEGDAESGPPAAVQPCCAKHFPHLACFA